MELMRIAFRDSLFGCIDWRRFSTQKLKWIMKHERAMRADIEERMIAHAGLDGLDWNHLDPYRIVHKIQAIHGRELVMMHELSFRLGKHAKYVYAIDELNGVELTEIVAGNPRVMGTKSNLDRTAFTLTCRTEKGQRELKYKRYHKFTEDRSIIYDGNARYDELTFDHNGILVEAALDQSPLNGGNHELVFSGSESLAAMTEENRATITRRFNYDPAKRGPLDIDGAIQATVRRLQGDLPEHLNEHLLIMRPVNIPLGA